MAENKVSFTIRRPSPVSRGTSSGAESDSSSFKIPALPKHLTNGGSTPGSPLARSSPSSPKPSSRRYNEQDSSDEEEATEDELVTGFDQFGVQRLHERKVEPQGPLVIPALKNRDWREFARKRKALYVPPSGAATTGADGSVGGLGTRDAINSGPQLTGLQMKKRVKLEDGGEAEVEETVVAEETMVDVKVEDGTKEEETEDQKALRAILAGADDPMGESNRVEIIPTPTEDDAYKQDVAELPEPATLDDYERVPVSQFGAALLRGMGWKEGTAASKKNKGLVEPWLPQARPALLGIGAKEKEVFDDGSAKGKKGGKSRPEKRYVPVVKKEREGSSANGRETNGNGIVSRRPPSSERDRRGSRRSSRSPDHDRRRERDRRDDYERDRDRRRDDRRDPDSSRRDRERDRDRDRDRRRDNRDSDSHRRDRDRRR